METVKTMRIAVVAYLLLLCSISIVAQNHELSQHITKLSEWSGQADVEDYVPEMEIVGQNIHTIWVRHVSGSEGYLYYRRSTDLGKTWEAPKLIHTYTNPDWAKSFDHRKLAVEGEKVYIATADYNYQDNGTSRIYFYESVNAGANFAAGRVLSQNEGGYRHFYNSLIKVKNGKIAIAYQGETSGIRKGTWFLYSSNGGASFTDTRISEESSGLSDLFFDGNQAIVLHNYTFFNNGLHTGRVWVSTTTDGTTFTTNKISPKYTATSGESEKCLSRQFENYSAKIAKSGNNIVVVFEGNISEGVYTILYARSTNNGLSFEAAKDLNNGIVRIDNPKETVAAANGNFYIAYQSYGKDYKFYFSKSIDNGATFCQPINLMPTDLAHVGYSNLPNIVIDPLDQTGKTFYITGNWFYSTKSTDGGNSFSQYQMLAPSLQSVMYDLSYGNCSSWMKVDSKGQKHWISKTLYRFDKISDILYRNIKQQPEPGTVNKSFYVETTKEDQYKLDQIVVPDNPTIRVDSAMTTELWVRFRTGNDNQYDIISTVFTKLNGPAGYYDDTPDGYHLAFRKEKNLIQLNSGLKTDKGSFVNWSDIDLNDNLWHHVAITYDARAGKNNYKIYINGLLNKQQTVTGKVYEDVGMLILGSSNMTYSPRQIKYDIDNFRLWNKALTQEEIIGNQTAKLTGKEEGLLLFLNFDDTYKDLTGRGNDGIPVYDGRLEQSDFDAPLAVFDIFQKGKSVSINNNTKNASSWRWNFGDATTSAQGNPVHDYAQPGEYTIALTASNSNSVASALKPLTIVGLDRIEPTTAGNVGYSTFTVYGGGITKSSVVKFEKDGKTLLADTTIFQKNGELIVSFNLDGEQEGKWNVLVNISGTNYTLKDALTLEAGKIVDPYVSISGRGTVLANMWQIRNIEVGNAGNVDLFNVPLFIEISDVPGMEIEFVNFELALTEYSEKLGHGEIKDLHPPYLINEGFTKSAAISLNSTNTGLYSSTGYNSAKNSRVRVYPLIIDVLPQNSSMSLLIRVKSPENYEMVAWTYGFSETSILKSEQAKKKRDPFGDCLWEATKTAMYNVSGDALSLLISSFPVGCAKACFDAMYNGYKVSENGNPQVRNTIWDLTSIAVNCGGYLTGASQAWNAALSLTGILMTGYSSLYDYYNCWDKYTPAWFEAIVVASFDPNEMVGPSGFGDRNYIVKYDKMPYTILFENKKEATAPAHIVTIIDTLDLAKFNVAEFGFKSFGWGDTIIAISGQQQTKFSADVDLRPGIELIVRVSGQLDTLSGVVRWEFRSLNPQTMDLEEDPFIGFLPPNKTSPEGEGFVSFSVGLKKGLKTDDEIYNQATILFDANAPIVTNNYLNTIDIESPESRVDPLESNFNSNFEVNWSGSDKGSGISHYSIYVLENDTLLYPWKKNTTELSAKFSGKVGSTYKFYSIATDNVSLQEETLGQYDTQTTITVNAERFGQNKKNISIWPNPVTDNLQLKFPNAPSGMYVIELVGAEGSLHHTDLYEASQLQHGINIDVSNCPRGLYILRVVIGNKNERFKVIIN